MSGPTLSIVIPVFNEPEWIRRSVESAAAAAASSEWSTPEIVVVDDGSTDDTGSVTDRLTSAVPVRVIHTENRGRLRARLTGIHAARGEYVLLLDARVLVTRGLDMLASEVTEGRAVWNAHCEVNIGGNVLAAFWDAMPRIFWSAYYANPRRLSYGIKDFVKYPKGTTCFLAPRVGLLDAYANFSSKYDDARDANDDTALIEHLAREYRVWISPEFACLYQPRQSLGRFGPHAFHRGIVFVDAYFRPGNPYAIAIGGFCGMSLLLLLAALRRPWLIPAALVTSCMAAGTAGLYKRLPPKHVASLSLVAPLFVLFYGTGIWAGLGMALRHRVTRHRGSPPSPAETTAKASMFRARSKVES